MFGSYVEKVRSLNGETNENTKKEHPFLFQFLDIISSATGAYAKNIEAPIVLKEG